MYCFFSSVKFLVLSCSQELKCTHKASEMAFVLPVDNMVVGHWCRQSVLCGMTVAMDGQGKRNGWVELMG